MRAGLQKRAYFSACPTRAFRRKRGTPAQIPGVCLPIGYRTAGTRAADITDCLAQEHVAGARSSAATNTGERSAGVISDAVRQEYPITHPAVSHHLRVLRENGFTTVRTEGTRRLYAVDSVGMRQADEWLDRFRYMWQTRLDALDTEIARGKRERRR